MRKLKLLMMAVLALALLAIPGTAMAKSRDRDRDHMADRWEKRHHLNTHRKDGKLDPDRDGLSNLGEFRARTNPHDADTDNDGMNDDAEEETGNNPNDRDSDDDGVEDGDEVSGTIASFDSGTGLLTITTANGDVSGTVVQGTTRIECEGEDEQGTVTAADHGSDDNSGPGSTSSGPGSGDDDQSGDDDAQGEDEQEDENEACTTADLTQGTPVHEAELEKGQFTEIELLK